MANSFLRRASRRARTLLNDSIKLWQGRLRLDVMNRFFIERVVGHWTRLLREPAGVPSVWTMFSDIWFAFWVILCGARSWT